MPTSVCIFMRAALLHATSIFEMHCFKADNSKRFPKNINQMSLFFHFLHCLFTFLLSTGGPCRCCTTGFGASEFVPTAPPRRAMGRKQKAAKEDGEEGGGGGGMHDIQGAWHGFAKFFFSGKKRFFLMRLQVLRDHLLG